MIQHVILALLWIAYCCIHSLLASAKCKSFFKEKAPGFFRYYRLSYTIFAAVTLALILYYQYSFSSRPLLHPVVIKYLALLILLTPGLAIMLVSIFKYFKLLSGVQSLFVPKPAARLRIDGVHRYMRHPLYFGTLLFTWGLFFIFPLLNNLIAVFILTAYVLIGIELEEKKLVTEFGEDYKAYQLSVPKLLPRLRLLGN